MCGVKLGLCQIVTFASYFCQTERLQSYKLIFWDFSGPTKEETSKYRTKTLQNPLKTQFELKNQLSQTPTTKPDRTKKLE